MNIRDTADVGEYIESGEWELKEASLVRNVVKYSCCPDPYVDITYTIHVKRKVLYYLSNLILPCVLLAALTVFTHCLPPESGERMGLAITILLGLTVFMLLFTDNVPRTSEVFPLIGKYAFTVLCEVAVSLLFTTYILIVYHKNPNKEMSSWFRFMIHNVLAPLLCKTPPSKYIKLSHLRNKTCFPCLHNLVKTEANEEEFESRSVKTRDAVEGFHLLENSDKLCRGFHQAMKARKTCFIPFIKLLFLLLTKRKTVYEVLTVSSHNSETGKPHCSRHFCAS